MNISDCIDQEFINLGKHTQSSLFATSLDEIELLNSVAKLLYKTKSVRESIKLLDTLNSDNYTIIRYPQCISKEIIHENNGGC